MSSVQSSSSGRPIRSDLWVALCCLIAALATNTWLIPSTIGYVISGFTLVCAGTYIVLVANVDVRLDVLFVALFGGYWLVLAAGWFVDGSPARLLYIVVTPLSVVVAVFLLPAVIDRHRGGFVAGLTGLGAIIAAIGFGMLLVEMVLSISLHMWTGGFVYGIYGLRTNSVFANPNTYGFLMMICTISAVFHISNRGFSATGLGALAICGGALITSDSTAAHLGTGFGLMLFVAATHRAVAVTLIAGGTFLAGVLFAAEYALLANTPLSRRIEELIMSLLTIRVVLWQASIERLLSDPLVGIGFADTAAEIQPYLPADGPAGFGTHNSYIHILLQTGLVAGSLYLLAVFYAINKAVYSALIARNRRDPITDVATPRWSIYVMAVLVAILVALIFESMTIGGLSLNSVLFGIYLGLALSLGDSWIVTIRPREMIPSV